MNWFIFTLGILLFVVGRLLMWLHKTKRISKTKKQKITDRIGLSALIIATIFLVYKGYWDFGIWFVGITLCYFIFKKAPLKTKHLLVKVPFIIAFASAFLNLAFPGFFSVMIFCIAIGVMFTKTMPQSRKLEGDTLQKKIQNELNISFVKHHEKKFWKPFRWIGGFMTPMMPFFTVVNTRWKKKKDKEAIIHENCHIYLLLHKGWIFYMFFYIILIVGLSSTFIETMDPEWLIILFYAALMDLFFVSFEFATFDLTKKIGKKFGVKARSFEWTNAKRYYIIYFVQMTIIMGIFYLLREIWMKVF